MCAQLFRSNEMKWTQFDLFSNWCMDPWSAWITIYRESQLFADDVDDDDAIVIFMIICCRCRCRAKHRVTRVHGYHSSTSHDVWMRIVALRLPTWRCTTDAFIFILSLSRSFSKMSSNNQLQDRWDHQLQLKINLENESQWVIQAA